MNFLKLLLFLGFGLLGCVSKSKELMCKQPEYKHHVEQCIESYSKRSDKEEMEKWCIEEFKSLFCTEIKNK